jgi:hypothetical protein
MKQIKIYFLLCLLISVTSGQTFPVVPILENGMRAKRINMVFLGDGYQITEMQKYLNDVRTTLAKVFLESPYKEYKTLFNVYAIEVPSNESGTDHPGKAADCGSLVDSVFKKDTYFDTSFDIGSIHRLLVVQNTARVYEVLKNNFPEYDIIMMVVNHNWYGGSGGAIAVYSTNSLSAEVAIHETGHTFANLSDEYDYGYPQSGRYYGINVTPISARDSIPWKSWIDSYVPVPTPLDLGYFNSVGLFEGAYYTTKGMFRPKVTCKMRDTGSPFCEICIEQHIKSMFERMELIDEHTPSLTNITMTVKDKREFSIKPLQLELENITSGWYLDNKLVSQQQNSFTLDGSTLTSGIHKLSAIVQHKSAMVRSDPYNLMQSKLNWVVEVENPTGIEAGNIPKEFALEQNYPNPFNPETVISYRLPVAGFVSLKVYDLLGREVTTLVDEYMQPGFYTYPLSADDFKLTSGLYFYTLSAGNYYQTKKMIVVK